MFKRNLVLGGLIAGAFLLPNLAVAGVVTGQCVNCHTMHNSQGGAGMLGLTAGSTAKSNLLGGTGCAGCHADPAAENQSNGKSALATRAPQVDNNGTSGYILNGGYFTLNGADNIQHNVSDDTAIGADAAFTNVPGGSGAYVQISCQSCHSASGHHSPSAGKYRMLTGSNTTIAAGTAYGAKAGAAGVTSGNRRNNIYQATNMNNFCAGCHGTFHGASDQGGPAAWVRHPTDVQVTNSTNYPSIVNYQANADIDAVVVGSTVATPTETAAATDRTVMCISCHVPHGGPYADLLSFNYAANQAGGTTVSTGCETCHSYSSNGM